MMHERVIKLLMQMQEEEGITDDELATTIGIKRPSWGHIKQVKRFSKKFLKGARAAYPGIFLLINISNISNSEGEET